MSEEGLNLVVADLWSQTAHENLAVASLGFLGVHLLVVDDVVSGNDDLVDGICLVVDDECEATGASGGGVGLDIYALNVAILTEVIAQLLCGKGKTTLVWNF